MFLKALNEAMLKEKDKSKKLLFNRDDNLEDDESIFRLKMALKDNPPNLAKRLKKHDVN